MSSKPPSAKKVASARVLTTIPRRLPPVCARIEEFAMVIEK
jgi:hypothetical protein